MCKYIIKQIDRYTTHAMIYTMMHDAWCMSYIVDAMTSTMMYDASHGLCQCWCQDTWFILDLCHAWCHNIYHDPWHDMKHDIIHSHDTWCVSCSIPWYVPKHISWLMLSYPTRNSILKYIYPINWDVISYSLFLYIYSILSNQLNVA